MFYECLDLMTEQCRNIRLDLRTSECQHLFSHSLANLGFFFVLEMIFLFVCFFVSQNENNLFMTNNSLPNDEHCILFSFPPS